MPSLMWCVSDYQCRSIQGLIEPSRTILIDSEMEKVISRPSLHSRLPSIVPAIIDNTVCLVRNVHFFF